MQHVIRTGLTPFDFQGLRITDFGPGGDASASVAVIEVAPGVAHREARSNRSDKYYICRQGVVAFVVGGRPIELRESDLLVIAKGEWFSYTNDSAEAAVLLLVHVPPFDLASEEFR